MSPEKMVNMANQIAAFFKSQPGNAADKVAAHLRDFWAPPMREKLVAYVERGGEGLDESVLQAVRKI